MQLSKREIPTSPIVLREQAYSAMAYRTDGSPMIEWENIALTVDQANVIYLNYAAEGSEKASEIQELIADAKTYIRELYHD